MIQGKTKTQLEKDYRALQVDSSSSLKEFSIDRKKYHKKYILKTNVEETDSKASVIGRLVETLLFEPEEFDNRFCLSICTTLPTELMLKFVTSLATLSISAENKTFEEIAKEAYAESGFKLSFEAVLKKFSGSDAEIYYKELLEVLSNDLTVVTTQDVANAENIVKELQSNSVTADIVNKERSVDFDVYKQLQIEEYTVLDHKFKSMMDLVHVNHKDKTIQVYDLKCTWNVENFYEEYYLYRRAYIQAYLYFKACISMSLDVNSSCYGYLVYTPKFIVCDSTNYMNPLIYQLWDTDITDARDGFEYKGKYYPGVNQIIEDLKWALEFDKWNISRENFKNGGVINIKK